MDLHRIAHHSKIGLLLALSILCSCSPADQAGNKQTGRIILTGSSTIAPLAAEIGKRFESLHPGTRVDVQTGGSSRGIADARSGLADIGMVSRSLKPNENDLHPHTIARDGVCLIVHRDNPIAQLSDKQVIQIYTGRTANWRDVGGPDERITVINKAEGRATLDVFLKFFHLKSPQIMADVIIGDNEQGIKTVAGNPGAIGYVSIGTAAYDAERGVAIRLLPVRGVAATIANVANGTFPMFRELNLVTKAEPAGLVRTFIDYAQSKAAGDLIRHQNFVPIAKKTP